MRSTRHMHRHSGSGGSFQANFRCLRRRVGGQNILPGPFSNVFLGAFKNKARIGAASFQFSVRVPFTLNKNTQQITWTKSEQHLHAILVFSTVMGTGCRKSARNEEVVQSRIGGSFGAREYHCSTCHFTYSVGLKPASCRVFALTTFRGWAQTGNTCLIFSLL